jgi:hypothetical protein
MAGINPVQVRASSNDFHCIFLNLVGGPSHLDTWDPKHNAPSEYRGPFKAIRTNVPGISISELFPRMARVAHHYALVRSLYHDEAPIHETGQQLVQTGRIADGSQQTGKLTSLLIPGPIRNTGVDISHGQDAITHHISPDRSRGIWELGREPIALREQYGLNQFGQSCLLARRMVEQGVSLVTVNMFDTVYGSISWDCHADGSALNVNLNDYRDILGPMFDLAYSSLLMDLESRGLLNKTLVVAAGEFGRSPKINMRGGRDHWTRAWTAVLAGSGVRGGQIVGSTDRFGGEPVDRPIHASAIANTIRFAAGLPATSSYQNGEPIRDLFAGNGRQL